MLNPLTGLEHWEKVESSTKEKGKRPEAYASLTLVGRSAVGDKVANP